MFKSKLAFSNFSKLNKQESCHQCGRAYLSEFQKPGFESTLTVNYLVNNNAHFSNVRRFVDLL